MRTHRLSRLALIGLVALLPGWSAAQEDLPAEQPDPGHVVLGPRTVVSFVRQTLRAPDPVQGEDPAPVEPRWASILHVTNTGISPLGFAAIFVPAAGPEHRVIRFRGVTPGATETFTVADIFGDVPEDAPHLARGIVILRFFAPEDLATTRAFSHVVTAESIMDTGPGTPAQILPLEVGTPQRLYGGRLDRTLRR